MTLENLKQWRIVIPGIMVLLMATPFFVNPFDPGALSTALTFSGILYLIIVVLVGAVYDVIGIRWYLLAGSLKRIDDNIKRSLILPFENDPRIAVAKATLLQGRTLLDFFYYFIDKDESLKQRAKEVYFNGLIWSSLADIMILCTLGTVVFMIAIFYSHQLYYAAVAVILAVFVVLAALLIGAVERKHIQFGTDQINYILTHYKSDLRDKLLNASRI